MSEDFVKSKALAKPTKDFSKMSKKELIKIAETALLPITDPESYKEMIKAAMPEFVHDMDNKEDLGTSVYHSTQEMLLVLFDCLRRYHGWDEVQMKNLKRELTDVLTGAKEFEDSGLSFLSIHDVTLLGDKVEEHGIAGLMEQIAQIKLKKAKITKMGMEVPILPGAEKMLKDLTKLKR